MIDLSILRTFNVALSDFTSVPLSARRWNHVIGQIDFLAGSCGRFLLQLAISPFCMNWCSVMFCSSYSSICFADSLCADYAISSSFEVLLVAYYCMRQYRLIFGYLSQRFRMQTTRSGHRPFYRVLRWRIVLADPECRVEFFLDPRDVPKPAYLCRSMGRKTQSSSFRDIQEPKPEEG